MFKFIVKSQTVQYNWIRKNPAQWITLNLILTAAAVGYIYYKDAQETKQFENATSPAS